MTLYIKKLWSLNPTKCKFIPLEEALEDYSYYIRACIKINMPEIEIKTFKQWRTTEI